MTQPDRASHLIPRSNAVLPPLAARGDGVYVIGADGRRWLDGCGGAAVSCLGHSDAEVIAAIEAQSRALAFSHTGFFHTEVAEDLAAKLIAHAPEGIDRALFVAGGSEAVEAALKLARQYMIERGEPGRTRFIARRQSYHGNTLGALGTGGNMWRRAPFAPLMAEGAHIPPCYAYREQRPGESDADYGLRAAEELEAELLRLGPETVIGFVAEPVVGATLGAVPPAPGYFKRIREICDRYGILLILDEVMCGMSRCGTLFACTAEEVRPDIIAIAKGLGAGYQPIGAMLASGEIYDRISAGSGFFQHGHTYLAHPIACAAAGAVLDKLTGPIGAGVAQKGAAFEAKLRARFADHPNVGDIRGRGLFWGLELVADRASKAPFDPKLALHKRIKRAAFERGLMIYPMGGTIDGQRGDHVLTAPPFIISDVQMDELIALLSGALEAALREV